MQPRRRDTRSTSSPRFSRLLTFVWAICCLVGSVPVLANVDWLLQQRQADGSIYTAQAISTRTQATSEAIRTLRALGQGASVAPSETFLFSQTYYGTEDLNRLITANVERGASNATLIAELLTHQNADGGFGELPGFQSSAIDTALALSALSRAGQPNSSSTLAALNYLISLQASTGAWAFDGNDPSIFVTAHALEALWYFRQSLPAASTAAGRARTYLLAQRGANSLWGTNFESALALIALAPLQSAQGELAGSVGALSARQSANGDWDADVYTTALALRAITLASAPGANPDLASVSGTVVDGDTLVAIQGATVSITGPGGATRLSDAQGKFNFADLAAGSYNFSVEASGYPALTAAVNLRAGQALNLGVLKVLHTATSTTARVEGRITDSAGSALAGVTVSVTGGPAPVLTDSGGRYLLNDVAPGDATLLASKAGYFAAQGTTTLIAGSTVNFSVALRAVSTAGFNLIGTFTDIATGQPLSGVTVTVSGSASTTLVSAANGTISSSNLSPGEIRVAISLSGYQGRTALVTVNGGQTLDLSAALSAIAPETPATFTVRGRVIDNSTGAPIAGASIGLAGGVSASTTTAADGTYEIAGLMPGEFTASVAASGYQSVSASASASAFQTIDLSPALLKVDERPTGIRGVVLDADSRQPIEGAQVTVSSASGATTVLTLPGGGFLARNLTSEPTTVSVSAAGYESRSLTLVPVAGFINDVGELLIRASAQAVPVTLTGRVVDSTSNAALQAVTVTATSTSGNQIVQTGSDGAFSLSSVNGQVVEVEFTFANYVRARYTLVVAAESSDLGQVRLRPEGLDLLFPDLAVTSVNGSGVTSTADSYRASGTAMAQVRNLGYAAVEVDTQVVAFEDRNRNGLIDEGEPELGRATLAAGLQPGATSLVSMPVSGTTSFRDAPVTVLVDATGLVIERTEDNNSLSAIGSCLATPPAASALAPKLKWRWAGSPQSPTDNQVYGPVLVAQMTDDNHDGRIDALDMPDLIFPTRGQALTVVSGDDGHTIWQTAPSTVTGLGSPAVADIDADGLNEIVISNGARTRLLAFENDGTLKWSVPNGPTHSDTTRDGITIADLNADGVPEIITGRRVYSNTGTLLWQGSNDSGGLLSYGTLPIAADIDRDGVMEVIAGRTAYRGDGTVKWHQSAAVADGFNAIGNFDDDEFPEIVLVSTGRVYLLDHTGAIKWGPVTLSGSANRGGAPTVGDFDGDGKPEIGIAGASFYTVLETDGSLKWRQPISDASSAFTGSSLFDFDGDGRTEVVYADETNLWIFDGATGQVLERIPNVSGTTLEYPVVADVDGDGRAELVVAANESTTASGVRVFEGGQGEWMPTRAIWNESTYHVTNINDDGTVPRVEEPSWLLYNSYRQNAATARAAEPVADLTAGGLQLIDRGIGQPSSLTVRVGNAGAALAGGLATLAFYDGAPTSGGVLLGTATVPALAPGAYADVQLDGITSVSSGGTLYAVVDSALRVTECNEANNIVSTPGRPALGSLSVTTDSTAYPPAASVQILSAVTNSGLFTNSYRVHLSVQDAAGNPIATLPSQTVTTLASGESRTLTSMLESSGLLAGSYRVVGLLLGSDGQQLATSTALFEIRHDSSQAPATSLRVSTDRPTYHTTDAVVINSLARNLTTSTYMSGVTVRLVVHDTSGGTALDQTLPIGEFVPGANRAVSGNLALVAAAQGTYAVTATLLDGSGTALVSANASFLVSSNLAVAITGAVSASATSVTAGQTLLCTRTATNGGTSLVSGLPLRYTVVRLADATAIDQQEVTVDLAAGGSNSNVGSLVTSGYATGDYACTLQAQVSGNWIDLGYAAFHVTVPPVHIDSSLTLGDRGRLLVLMDEMEGWPCSAVRDIELWAPFRSRLPLNARIDVELLDAQGTRVDFESVALSNYQGSVNQHTGGAADLRITGASSDVITVEVAGNGALAAGYRIVATATADSLPAVVIESDVMGSSCGWHVGIGSRFGDFHCSGGHAPGGAPFPLPQSPTPSLEQQRAFLEARLQERGWSFKVVTSDEEFESELRTGAYTQYLLLAEHEKLDEQAQKELREAVYRGEGLFDAGRHDARHHAFDSALGIIPLGANPGASAVRFNAPWMTTGTASLHADAEPLRVRLDGATALAKFSNVYWYDTAATDYVYGRGRSIFVGYDLLAEATQAGSASLHTRLLMDGLDRVRPLSSNVRAGQVVPLRVTLHNRGVATPGRVSLPLPTGVTLVDPGSATFASGALYWTFSLAVDEQKTFTAWVRMPAATGSVAFDAQVQSGTGPSYVDQGHAPLTVQSSTRATLEQARALADHSIFFITVRFWLQKADLWLDRGNKSFALASLVQASSDAMLVPHPQAPELRWEIDDAIWTLSREVEE